MMMKKGEKNMKKLKEVLLRIMNKKPAPMPLVNWAAPAFVGVK